VCRAHPKPRVRKMKAHEKVTASRRTNPAFPHANGFNGFLRALPGDRALLSPSPADHPANLTPASRRQNHTTSPSARLRCSSYRAHPRPPHPAPNVRDDRETPLLQGRDARIMDVFRGKREGKYFYEGDWTGRNRLIGFRKFGVRRRAVNHLIIESRICPMVVSFWITLFSEWWNYQ